MGRTQQHEPAKTAVYLLRFIPARFLDPIAVGVTLASFLLGSSELSVPIYPSLALPSEIRRVD